MRYKIKDKEGKFLRTGIYKQIKYYERKEIAQEVADRMGGQVVEAGNYDNGRKL